MRSFAIVRTLSVVAMLLGLAAACGDDGGSVARSGRPDIVFILTDDQRYDALGCAGNPWLKTPSLDRIAAEGAYFENSFVVSPICSPSRASILTGEYGHRTGVLSTALSGDVLSGHSIFPELLQAQGYETAFIGKWHLPNPDAMPYRGFDRWVSFEGQGKYEDAVLNVDGVRGPSKGYLADILADYAVEWLATPREKPACLFLSLKNPHFPYDPSARRNGSLANAAIELPVSAAEDPATQPAFIRLVRSSPRMIRLPEQAQTVRFTIIKYLESVLSVDDVVGRVFDALETSNRLSSTCLVFTSDNGILLGEHGLVQKNRSYEESIRVPLLIRFPAEVAAGTRIAQPVLNIDLAPTFVDLAGGTVPPSFQGHSLRPLWSSPGGAWRDVTLHVEPPRSGNVEPAALSLRTSRWKYVRYRPGGIEEALFDLEEDELEQRNAALDPRNLPVMEELRARTRAEMNRVGMPDAWWDPSASDSTASDD